MSDKLTAKQVELLKKRAEGGYVHNGVLPLIHRLVNDEIEGGMYVAALTVLGAGLLFLVAVVYALWRLVG